MNQNGDNNYYNNDYSRSGVNQGINNPYGQHQEPVLSQHPYSPAGGRNNKSGGIFLLVYIILAVTFGFALCHDCSPCGGDCICRYETVPVVRGTFDECRRQFRRQSGGR